MITLEEFADFVNRCTRMLETEKQRAEKAEKELIDLTQKLLKLKPKE